MPLEAFARFDLTWTNGPLTVNYGLNFFSKLRRYTEDQVRANPDIAAREYLFYRDKWEHDLQVSVAATDQFSFYFGANNLLDDRGDVASINTPYSYQGRFLYAGARVALDKLF